MGYKHSGQIQKTRQKKQGQNSMPETIKIIHPEVIGCSATIEEDYCLCGTCALRPECKTRPCYKRFARQSQPPQPPWGRRLNTRARYYAQLCTKSNTRCSAYIA